MSDHDRYGPYPPPAHGSPWTTTLGSTLGPTLGGQPGGAGPGAPPGGGRDRRRPTWPGVERGTPAEQAGLRPGDIIIAVDGDLVTGAESLTGFIRQHASGDEVTLTVARDDERSQVRATLATREDQRP